MIVPSFNMRTKRTSGLRPKAKPYTYRNKPVTGGFARFCKRVFLLALVVVLGWFGWVYHEIEHVAHTNEAQPADAIAVFGAAEYGGHPSPVLHARLDHAVTLYHEQIAPVIITLGGGAGAEDEGNTEGAVGRDYLLANGVPYDHIIAETESIDTEQQAQRLAAIATANHFHRVVVVSDGTHLFRIRELCRAQGLEAYPSPRPLLGHISALDMDQRILHEVLSYTAWRLHLHISWLHEWLEGKADI
jgi:uncharacterized SAM-binding protein YcdF (DUF218 family)